METNELTIKLEQRDWERLQQLSERNGEPAERLAARLLAAYLAKILVKPPEVPEDSEVMSVYKSFVEGRKQTKNMLYHQESEFEALKEPSLNIGDPGLNVK